MAPALPYDPVIISFATRDVRFPTSLNRTGSDAMNAAGDYSAAYCILHCTCPGVSSAPSGHGMTFTIGRGNDLVVAAIPYFASRLLEKPLSSLVANFGATWDSLVGDSQIRWVGPEKGVAHLALAAVVNALWDLWAKVVGMPVWALVAGLSPAELVACVGGWRYMEDALTPAQAVEMLEGMREGKEQRVLEARRNVAVPVYTTSAGWLGFSDERLRSILRETKAQGFTHFKLKVGARLEDDERRLGIAREVVGDDAVLMVDANQVWSVPVAINWMKALAKYRPWFIEEPTSPDDVLGHKRIRHELRGVSVKVATGEMCQNRVIFKQLIAGGAIDVCQVDACRLGGLNEVLAVLLLAKRYGVPVIPHSGGVGLPEYTAHVSAIDYICISGQKSLLEHVDSLHEHFLYPAKVADGHSVTPLEPGYSVEMKPESMDRYEFPGQEGTSCFWRSEEAGTILNAEKI